MILSERKRGRQSPCLCSAPGPMHILSLFGSLRTSVSCGLVKAAILEFVSL